MHKFGLWILITFALYYIISLLTGSKKGRVVGCLFIGAVLALGIVLVI